MAVSCEIYMKQSVILRYGYWILPLYFALEEIDHAFEEDEFVFLEFFLFLKLLIDRGELLHRDFQIHLVKVFGVLAQFVEFGEADVAVPIVLYLLDIEQHLFHPILGIVIAGGR